jgi:transposase
MQSAKLTNVHGFDPYDRRRLARALEHAADVRLYRRLQAVFLVAWGWAVREVARLTAARPWAIFQWVRRYLRTHRPQSLQDAACSGRPAAATRITDARILRELRRDPRRLGYQTTGWTVSLLARHLSQKYDCPIGARPLRRRLRRLGLRWKRPRYVYATKEPHRAQKKGRLSAA